MPSSPPSPKADSARWFAEEVQPHEPALRAYLRGSFPKIDDVDDLVQGVMIMRAKGEHLGIYHVGTAEEVSIADLARRGAKCCTAARQAHLSLPAGNCRHGSLGLFQQAAQASARGRFR